MTPPVASSTRSGPTLPGSDLIAAPGLTGRKLWLRTRGREVGHGAETAEVLGRISRRDPARPPGAAVGVLRTPPGEPHLRDSLARPEGVQRGDRPANRRGDRQAAGGRARARAGGADGAAPDARGA